ncbi:hypothetical protein DXG01_006072 [Tephrocybe rancida]|nr:hypothetical protein DXG01_006072 [Tephrocybe rancida]
MKPLFILWDKVYQKTSDPIDEKWLLWAWEASLRCFKGEFGKNEILRPRLVLVLFHLSLEGSTPEICLKRCTARNPELTDCVVRDGFNSFLTRGTPSSKSAFSVDDVSKPWNMHFRLSALLLSTMSFAEDTELNTCESMIVDAVLLGHHHLICGNSRQTWIDLCQRARADHHDLTIKHMDKFPQAYLKRFVTQCKDASYSAVSTLTFVSPETVLPRIMEQLQADINSTVANVLTKFDLGVWKLTPEGTTYVDGQLLWDEETRRNITTKRAAATKSLTKQRQALVNAQLEEEAKIR